MIKVLFIGNSHVYYNDMPDIFKRICKWNGKDVFPVMLAHGGVGLEDHLNDAEAPFNIKYGKYDYVVLQHRANPFVKESLMTEGMKLAHYVMQSGAKGVMYMPWPRRGERDDQQRATAGYLEFIKETGFAFAPAGEAWWSFFDKEPETELFRPDDEHATKKGSYLAACTIYSAMFGERAKTDGEELHEKMAKEAYEAYARFKD